MKKEFQIAWKRKSTGETGREEPLYSVSEALSVSLELDKADPDVIHWVIHSSYKPTVLTPPKEQ